MNPADLTINTSALNASLLQRNGVSAAGAASLLPTKAQVPRVDLEPIYLQLKSALGDAWADYKQALSAFVLGSLNQAELSWVLQPLLSPAPSVITSTDSSKSPVSTLHLHNTLLTCLYANIQRDPPPAEVAPWVVSVDKPLASTKSSGAGSGATDQTEERLKHEVIAIHARDRKRIKALKDTPKAVNDGFHQIQEYAHELAVKPPSQAAGSAPAEPQSAGGANSGSANPTAAGGTGTGAGTNSSGGGGLAKTNFDLEIRRRYAQPLACETLEFPGLADLQNRIEPICYEEGLAGGVAQGTLAACAELVEQAAEVFVKEMLGSLLAHARENLSGGGAAPVGVRTALFRRQLRREEADADRGILQRSASGLLPVEMDVRARLEPLGLQDLRFSLGLADAYLLQDRFLAEQVMLDQLPQLDGDAQVNGVGFGDQGRPMTNGHVGGHAPLSSATAAAAAADGGDDVDAMAVDDPDYVTFKGISKLDHESVMGALDDCLMVVG